MQIHYLLKQASRQWYLKFDEVITSLGFIENALDQCIYKKFDRSSFVSLVLYVNDILLVSNYVNFLNVTKHMLSCHFDMKDLGETSSIIGIQIHRDRLGDILSLSQATYIE